MAKIDPAAELAGKMVQALERLREQGDYPIPLTRLAALADPEATPDLAAKAVKKKPFAARLLAAAKHPAAPVVLAEDVEQLVGSPGLVEFAVERLPKPEKRLYPAAKVASVVDKSLRPAFASALQRRMSDGPPAGEVGFLAIKGKPYLYLKSLPPPAVELSEKLVRTLGELRAQGEDAYPLPLKDLAARTAPEAPPALLKEALALDPFASQVVWTAPGKPDAPVALAADRDALVGGPVLLKYTLLAATSPRKPLASLPHLSAPLAEGLRQTFTEAVGRAIAEERLPPFAGAVGAEGGPELYLKEYAPPAWVLSRKLLAALRERKKRGGDAYPTRLDRLGELADPSAPPELVEKAVADKSLKNQVVRVLAGDPQGPIALAEDAAELAASPLTLEAVLTAVRTADHQAVPAADLKKKVAKELRPAFDANLAAWVETGTLPRAVACLRIKKKPHLFLIRDVFPEAPPAPAAPARPVAAVAPTQAPPAADFAPLFDAAFDRLDRQKGSYNLVSLVDLRLAVPVERDAFDEGMHRLRRAGRYSLSSAEGRHGLTPEERAAGLNEGGTLLLYVSRKTS